MATVYPASSNPTTISISPSASPAPAPVDGGVRKRRTPSEEAAADTVHLRRDSVNGLHNSSYTNQAFVASSTDITSPNMDATALPSNGVASTSAATVPKSDESGFWARWKRASAAMRLTHFGDFFKNFLGPSLSACSPFGRRRKLATHRTVIPNHLLAQHYSKRQPHPNRRYAGNKIKTTKYSLLTFVPKNLFEQFHRFANLYFVFIVLLNWIPQVEAIAPELSMIPVVFVLSVTAVKDLYEDRRRYKSDRKVNYATCRVFNPQHKRYMKTEWRNVIVGDFVHLSCNEIIPADILLVRSSDPAGVCYVETSNLDGESNLKQRHVIASLLDRQGETFSPVDFKSTIECEPPNNQIYKFTGFLLHPDGQREAVNKNNLLLRGCEVRNTDYIEGIVVYAGHETKAMLNNSGPRYKRSKLERFMNWDIVWCVVILLLMCFAGALGGGIWLTSFEDPLSVPFLVLYKANTINRELEGFLVFWTYIIILQVMIPISLYVTIELVKLGQIFFITKDPLLYYPPVKKGIQCRALNIPEELGQIEYVLSDKTGTLTENQMIFRRCAIAGIDYGQNDSNTQREQTDFSSCQATKDTSKDVKPNVQLQQLMANACIEDSADLQLSCDKGRVQTLFDFFINMAVCNTVVVNPHPHADRMNASGYVADDSGGSHSLGNDTRSSYTANSSNLNDGLLKIGAPAAAAATATATASTSTSGPSGQTPVDYPSPRYAKIDQLQKKNGFHVGVLPKIVTTDSMSKEESSIGSSSEEDALDDKGSTTSAPKTNGDSAEKPTVDDAPKHRPSNFHLHKKLLQLPMLAKNRLPPVGGKKQQADTPTASPGYRNPVYEAESPDELALVYASAAYGFRLVKRHTNSITIELPNMELLKFQILHILPFDSVRKRMSVIVKHPKTKKILLYCKGADASIMDALSPRFCESQRGQTYLYKAQEYLNLYASYGLRTLCLAKRELATAEYQTWATQHEDAEISLDEDREKLIFESALRIERDMELLGVSGIEDRLQDGVAECISALRNAGIKVWVLTGDKIETAVNIAYACKLFAYGMELIQLCTRNEGDAETLLQHHLDRLTRRNLESDSNDSSCQRADNLAVVVDGATLTYFLTPKLQEKFVQLVSRCTSVLCCRATPLQKASVVRLVKEKMEGTTLAVGDGANDVSMIQCADVGVGISGQEGMQAVMASDFAMPQFRFLQRLLLVHGHWCYDRLARMVLYFFYKNATFVFTLFWYQFFCGFTAKVPIDPTYLMLHNLVFTSLPPLLLGIFDQDVSDDLLLEQPALYLQGPKALLYRTHSFWLNIFDALWQSIVCYFVPHMMYHDTEISMWSFGFLIASALVLCNIFHLLVDLRSWTPSIITSAILSILLFYAFALGYSGVSVKCCSEDPPYWVAERMVSDSQYWFGLLLIVVMALFPKFVCLVMTNTLLPSDVLRASIKSLQKRKAKSLPFMARFSKKTKSVSFVRSTSQSTHAGVPPEHANGTVETAEA